LKGICAFGGNAIRFFKFVKMCAQQISFHFPKRFY